MTHGEALGTATQFQWKKVYVAKGVLARVVMW